jgi:hypothetical protein
MNFANFTNLLRKLYKFTLQTLQIYFANFTNLLCKLYKFTLQTFETFPELLKSFTNLINISKMLYLFKSPPTW